MKRNVRKALVQRILEKPPESKNNARRNSAARLFAKIAFRFSPVVISPRMTSLTPSFLRSFAGPRPPGAPGYLIPRWIFLRALGLIYLSAFYSFAFQIRGLIGPHGLLPAGEYLEQVARVMGHTRYWYAPTLLLLGSGPRALAVLCWAGIIAWLLPMGYS